MRDLGLLFVVGVLVVSSLKASGATDGGVAETMVPPPPPDGGIEFADGGMPREVEVVWAAEIPIRDGRKLSATLYKPKSASQVPVIFGLTSRIADSLHDLATDLARTGFVFAAVDLPGRGNSAGEFQPFDSGGQEGHDVAEWLAQQPWSSGSVGMCGATYDGFVQWSTAKENPPHLKTMVPISAMAPGVDFPMVKNVEQVHALQWLASVNGRYEHEWALSDRVWLGTKLGDLIRKGTPFSDLRGVFGSRAEVFARWLEHPVLDSYWEAKLPSAAQYKQLAIPVLTIVGQYDPHQLGALHYYRAYLESASGAAREQHYLVIGAWNAEALWQPPKDLEMGGIKLGPASAMDMKKLHREWFDWTLRGAKKPDFLKQRVAYYVTGAEEWRYADTLEAATRQKKSLFLASSEHGAREVFASGRLVDGKPSDAAPDEYAYDPKDTRGIEIEQRERKNWMTDAEAELTLKGAGLVYHSDVFTEPLELTGFTKLTAWIEMDVPDTDFKAILYEVLSNGTSVRLGEDQQRARYRQSLKQEQLVVPNRAERYEFTFNFVARRIAKGSRVRLVFRAPRSVFTEWNYNCGQRVSLETPACARTAHVKLLHDEAHPSVLEIPLGG
jgi:putative CocE/NonD family hydrolase